MRSEALVGFEAPRATQMSQPESRMGSTSRLLECWNGRFCEFDQGQLPTAAALQEQGVGLVGSVA